MPWNLESELRFAARRLRRAPSFSLAVILVLALGVAAATTVFTFVDGILLQPLPYTDPSRLVRLTHTVSGTGAATLDQSDASLLLYQREARAFDGVAAWRFDDGDLGPTEPQQNTTRVRGARVSANFFDVLGVRPSLGRGFAAGEDRPGRNGVVVISQRLWLERFHGDPSAVGRRIVVNDVPRTIIGIMPPRFAYPKVEVALWLPLSIDPAHLRPATFNLVGIGRVARGVSLGAARADLARVLPDIGGYFGADVSAATWQGAHIAPRVQPLRDSIVGPVSHLLWLLFGSVVLVLLVACTNVAGLFLVRAERAQLELAVRGALGSGLAGLLALSLSESALLSILGGAVGVALAELAVGAAPRIGALLALPRIEDVRVDSRVLLFAVAATTFCALFVSFLPLLRARRVSLAQVIRGTGTLGRRTRQRARDALVVAQIALALVLVASSVLLGRSLLRLTQVRPGFDAEHVVVARVLLPYARYGHAAQRAAFFEAMARQARAIPGARDVALTDWVPLDGDHHDLALDVEDYTTSGGARGADHSVATVDGDYFATMRIPLVRGRTFGIQDAARPADEVVVSRAFAERYWRGANPIGKRIRPLGGQWFTVIGEVDDVHYDALEQAANEIVYFPIVGSSGDGGATTPAALSLVVRTGASDAEALAAIRGIVHGIDVAVPTYDESTLSDLVHDASARPRALTLLLAVASLMTSLLGAIGLYGVIAYGVGMRRRELGVRIALGARPADVTRMISMDGVRLGAIGIVIGLGSTLLVGHLARGVLYGVSPMDPVTLSAAPIALLAVAFVASWLPARSAGAVDPAEALRAS